MDDKAALSLIKMKGAKGVEYGDDFVSIQSRFSGNLSNQSKPSIIIRLICARYWRPYTEGTNVVLEVLSLGFQMNLGMQQKRRSTRNTHMHTNTI